MSPISDKLTRMLPGGGGSNASPAPSSPSLPPADTSLPNPTPFTSTTTASASTTSTSTSTASTGLEPSGDGRSLSSHLPNIPHVHLPSISLGRKDKPSTPLDDLAKGTGGKRTRRPTLCKVLPGTASSCQLFNMFKVMAADGTTTESLDVDTDEDEETPYPPPSGSKVAALAPPQESSSDEGSFHHASSETTVVPREKDDDERTVKDFPMLEEDQKTALERWMQDTLTQDMRNADAMSTRLAALSMSNMSPYTQQQGQPSAHTSRGKKSRPPLPVFTMDEAAHDFIDSPDEYESGEETDDHEHDGHPHVHGHGHKHGHKLPLHPPLHPGGEDSTDSGMTTDDSASIDSSSTGLTTPYDPSVHTEGQVSNEEKLAVIVEEFGAIDSNMINLDGTPSESERLLAESKGSLFKGVMMIGNLHLTTHRLLFHALLPPDNLWNDKLVNTSAEQTASMDDATFEAAKARVARPDILQAGPVTVHRGGLFKTKKRVWMELGPDMVTTYPSADEAGRARPYVTVLLSTCLRLEPYDPEAPCDFRVTYESPEGPKVSHFTVDTAQSALQWRRQFEGAMFRFARERFRKVHKEQAIRQGTFDPETDAIGDQWTMMRCCIPLDRVNVTGIESYHSFATLVNLDVGLDENVTWNPEAIAEGDFTLGSTPRHPEAVRDQSPARTPSLFTGPERKPSIKGTDSPKNTSGANTPKRHFSFGNALKRDKSVSVKSEPAPTSTSAMLDKVSSELGKAGSSPSGHHVPHRSATTYIDSAIPPRLGRLMLDHPEMAAEAPTPFKPETNWRNTFKFMVAVLNEQSWFASELESAVHASKNRKFRPDVVRPRMVLDVGGYDCLATDEELDAEPMFSRDSTSSASGSEVEDDEDNPRSAIAERVHRARKAEKATMAAKLFGLREDEGIWLKRCYIASTVVPARGHIILTPRYICFWRRVTVGYDIKYRFSCGDIKGAEAIPSIRAGIHCMALKIHGQHDLKFDFWNAGARDEVIARIEALIAVKPTTSDTGSIPPRPTVASQNSADSTTSTQSSTSSTSSTSSAPIPIPLKPSANLALNPDIVRSDSPKPASMKHAADILAPPKEAMFQPRAFPDEALGFMPFIANKPWRNDLVRLSPRHFAMLTIGSRGDVQPYIALALRLMKDGHKVTIVTHDEFKKWVEGYGIGHRQAGGDPTALMKLSTEHKMFSPGFFKESLGSFRQWLDDLLLDSWNACKDADVLIESPSAMAGVHIAEALKIPYFRAFTMPWTRTSAYPQAFMVPAFEMGPSFNYSTYVLFDNIMWRATAGQINRWRKTHMNLPSTDMSSLSVTKVPFLYNFSPAVVPKPLDWHDDITITGYWTLENSDTEWTPPPALDGFMTKAKADGKPLVYIGFGSIIVPRPNAMTKSIIKAVEKADVRAIIAKGWSSRGGDPASEGEEITFPDCCFGVDKIPHGWLFPKIQAAMHHGGAGTVGASLRAGIPTLIKPWFGDQFFWAIRVQKLEVGLKVPSLRSDDIADALMKATTNKVMIEKAARVGERIRAENGVDNAVQAIHFNIIRAASDRTKMTWAK